MGICSSINVNDDKDKEVKLKINNEIKFTNEEDVEAKKVKQILEIRRQELLASHQILDKFLPEVLIDLIIKYLDMSNIVDCNICITFYPEKKRITIKSSEFLSDMSETFENFIDKLDRKFHLIFADLSNLNGHDYNEIDDNSRDCGLDILYIDRHLLKVNDYIFIFGFSLLNKAQTFDQRLVLNGHSNVYGELPLWFLLYIQDSSITDANIAHMGVNNKEQKDQGENDKDKNNKYKVIKDNKEICLTKKNVSAYLYNMFHEPLSVDKHDTNVQLIINWYTSVSKKKYYIMNQFHWYSLKM